MPKTLRVHRSAVGAAGPSRVAALVAVGFAPSHPTTQTRPLVKPAATCHGNGVKACPTTSTTTTSSTTTSPTTTTTTTTTPPVGQLCTNPYITLTGTNDGVDDGGF